ncbi:Trans-aconitate 2-methyltransferase [Cedecea neteri]|uniref:Trans-aconitate 2-methyltransferase n=1 Tax=Cedecea neteri TaxID=158822 RepID=A0A2X3L4I0_9ENTR|nr:Trans-aconitate 2-methyltransferase [Cedecea neteri]
MQDWNPALYLQFEAERTRPAAELVARISHPGANTFTDLGCGPGNSTALLRNLAPKATITGLDNSPAMLAKASAALPDCRFEEADIATWQPAVKQDVIFANASLQWITNHKQVFPHLAAQLADGGVLAVQMPDNWQEPTHTLMRQVADELGISRSSREALLTAQEYYDLLAESGCTVDIWRTTYFPRHAFCSRDHRMAKLNRLTPLSKRNWTPFSRKHFLSAITNCCNAPTANSMTATY